MIYSKYCRKKIHVAMQSFNCVTVIDAALAADADVTLLDNKLEDFSVSITEVMNIEPKPDVLILTHYQGIPNFEYEEIADYCRHNGIFLIDDVCQTEGSRLNNIEIGTLSDAAFGSFGFDKPISVFNGGYVRCNSLCNKAFKSQLTQSYTELDIETEAEALQVLRLFYTALQMTAKETYTETFDRSNMAIYPFVNTKWQFYQKLSINFMPCMLMKIYARLRHIYSDLHGENDNILRLSRLKQSLLDIQYKRLNEHAAEGLSTEEACLMQLLDKYGIHYPKNNGICWNRFSFLDPQEIFTKCVRRDEIQYGCYNWGTPMHLNKNVKNNKHVKFSSLPNSEFCAASMVNVPVWSDYFTELYRA